MTEPASIFAAGPPLVKSATGEDVTKEALGGPQVAADVQGVVHNVVADDGDAIAPRAAATSDYFPLNAWAAAPRRGTGPTPGPAGSTTCWTLIPPDPRRPYPIRPVLEAVVDGG